VFQKGNQVAVGNKPNQTSFKKGKLNPQWKGKSVKSKYTRNYARVHKWLKVNFGKADKCENPKCKCPKPKQYEWALKKRHRYEYKRKNFIKLCSSCHKKYDMTEEKRLKVLKNLIWYKE